MPSDVLQLPIVLPAVLVPVDVVAVVLVLLTVFGPRGRAKDAGVTDHPARRRWNRGLLAVLVRITAIAVGAGIGLVAVWWFGDVQDRFGVSFTPVTRMWVAFTAAAVLLFLVVLVQGGNGRRVVGLGAALAVALTAGLGINVDFGAYRTIGEAVTPNPYPTGTLDHQHAARPGTRVVDAATWTAPEGMPDHGRAIAVRIPATVSHFHARRAVVWLPPAAQVVDPPTLPVLVALSGQPGQPADMFQTGRLGSFLDHYAAAHHGIAPIVVSPDQLGAPGHNPMCVDSRRLGRSATYVMTDTVRWIHQHLDVASGSAAWGIGGFSQGATCAMQFSSAYPEVFGTTLAISSEMAPANGDLRHTVAVGFGGSRPAYLRATPEALLAAHTPYHDHLTVFGYGEDDAPYEASTLALRAASKRAGIATTLIVSPGSAHDWNTVRYVLGHGLPIVIAHLGLPVDGVRR
ncbi:esterase family protein [Curtobacterium sp. MCBD17_030]|uniref:alpha/beta hydrolase n=1 Tax=Curtobacterium sp. MCBD17_030 TaxID=2175649 RepID=UPI0011B6F89B|nr:alpha/beta hydrolase-fold protein [Curtobacterium sp. MCBD17_030]